MWDSCKYSSGEGPASGQSDVLGRYPNPASSPWHSESSRHCPWSLFAQTYRAKRLGKEATESYRVIKTKLTYNTCRSGTTCSVYKEVHVLYIRYHMYMYHTSTFILSRYLYYSIPMMQHYPVFFMFSVKFNFLVQNYIYILTCKTYIKGIQSILKEYKIISYIAHHFD